MTVVQLVMFYFQNIFLHAVLYTALTAAAIIGTVVLLALFNKLPTAIILRFERWLMTPFTWAEFVYFSVLYFLFEIADITLGALIVWGPPQDPSIQFHAFSSADLGNILLLFVAVALEEIIFRIVPFIIAIRLWGFGLPTFTALIGTSLVFGAMHGDLRNILIQGAGGFFFGIFFLKLSDSGKRPLQAAIFVIGLHFLYDMVIIALSGGF